MARVAVIAPATTRYALAEGDWVEFKNKLTIGEQKRLEGSGVAAVRDPSGDTRARQSFELDFERLGLARIEAYTTGWSFLGLDEKALPVNPDTISALDPAIAKEIETALDEHVKKMSAAKNEKAPAPVSVAS